MVRIIAGGTGLIGQRLVDHWLSQKHEIIVIGRSESRIKDTFEDKVKAIAWNHLNPQILQSAEVVLNLTGASIGAGRWTEARKKEIINSRVGSTKVIGNMLAELGERAPRLFNASAVGIYGLQEQHADGLPPKLDENAAIDWANPKDFLSQVAIQWEKSADPAIEKGVPVVFMRFGVVLGKEGGALPLLVRPFQFYLGGPIGSGNQPFSWVAIDDVVRAIDFLIEKKDAKGPFNIVSPKCVTQAEFAATLGHVMERPDVVPFPSFAVKLLFGEMGRELLLEGQRAYPERLLRDGFNFVYADLKSALTHALGKKD